MKRSFPAIALVVACACGGGGTTTGPTAVSRPSPSPSAPAVMTVRDGVTEAPVAGATWSPDPARVRSGVTVRAAGYLTREQLFDGSPVFLWPGESSYVHAIAYWEFRDGSERTVRWSGPFVVTLDGELADDAALVQKTQDVIAEMNRVSGLGITLGAGGAVVIRIDPNILTDEDAVGLADLSYSGPSIVGAQVVFANRAEITGSARSQYRNTLLHEMGHVLGLGHSQDGHDVMYPGGTVTSGSKLSSYAEGEAGCLEVLYHHRRAGNIFPDRDSAFTSSSTSSSPRTVRIVEPR